MASNSETRPQEVKTTVQKRKYDDCAAASSPSTSRRIVSLHECTCSHAHDILGHINEEGSDVDGGQEEKELNCGNMSPLATCRKKFFQDVKKKWTASKFWKYNGMFDPFQVFEVEHEACLEFEVTVLRGESITKGSSFKDFMDTPDPYVVLRVPGCSNSSKRTSAVDNSTNPIWDQSFKFYLDPAVEHHLKVILMDANYTLDETLGEDTFCINTLTNDVPVDYTFVYPHGSKVHCTLKLQKNKVPDLRFSLALCNEEKEFLMTRRKKILGSMQKLLRTKAPDTVKQVPIVGILGSGGGFRAMTCLSGSVKALHESGILDCATYIAGLSGSSWYISTLYAHDLFPNVTHQLIQEELRESVTKDWKWQLLNTPIYVSHMMAKYKRGQPVSFTDFFGHLLGDVLLKSHKHKKLTDTRSLLVQGVMPMPLYTCLHAKRNVSCRSFSEWVEFSPYEIGIAKYGTFMKTEDFGNKFIVGKKIKQFDELPLHFLQGVWGSAFTILIKRLVMEGGKKDIVQIMRDAQKENDDNLEDIDSSGEESDTEDEEDIDGNDDKEWYDEDDPSVVNGLSQNSSVCIPEEDELETSNFPQQTSQIGDEGAETNNTTEKYSMMKTAKSLDELCLGSSEERRKKFSGGSNQRRDKNGKGFSFDIPKRKTSEGNKMESRKFSTESDPGVRTENQTENMRKLSRQGAVKGPRTNRKNTNGDQNPAQKNWASRKESLRKARVERKEGLWNGLKQNIMGANILNSRSGRAGEVLNPFRGLSLRHAFPISPFATESMEEQTEDEVDGGMDFGVGCRYEPLDNKAKKLFVVDSGLAFNSPYPLLLRPQRAVDMYLSFDFSQRPEDRAQPFKELLLAEKWAAQNKVSFPPIEKLIQQYENEEVKECYVFKHPSDQYCPVIIHFPLVNNKFREFKAPGVPRETQEEKEFADFQIFDDPSNPYSSMNFLYEPIQFDRLTKLTEFNTLLSMDIIKKELEEVVTKKKQNIPKPLGLTDVVRRMRQMTSFARGASSSSGRELKLKVSLDKEKELSQYFRSQLLERQPNVIQRQRSRDSSGSEFSDAVEEQPNEENVDSPDLEYYDVNESLLSQNKVTKL